MENLDADATWLALEYVRGNLTDEEMEAVEARMGSDRDFYLLVHDLRQMQKAEAFVQDPEVSARAQAAADTHFAGEARHRPKIKWYIWTAAASVVAIVIFSVVLFRNNGRGYVKTYFEREPQEQFLGPSAADALRMGMSKYDKKEYKEAIRIFQSIADTASGYNTALFYIANAYLDDGQQEAALKPLLILDAMNDPQYLDRRQWLLGLIYLDQGEKEKAEKEHRALYDDKTSHYMDSALREIWGWEAPSEQ